MNYAYVDSYFVSDKYRIFVELGYPQLDVQFFEDGSWAILEMINAPVIPAQTKFRYILKGMENIEFSRSFVENFIKKLDPEKGYQMEEEEKKTQKLFSEHDAYEAFVANTAKETMSKLSKCDSLMERIVKNGPAELSTERIALAIHKESPQKARDMGISFEEVKK